jgi:hypothetical protein
MKPIRAVLPAVPVDVDVVHVAAAAGGVKGDAVLTLDRGQALGERVRQVGGEFLAAHVVQMHRVIDVAGQRLLVGRLEGDHGHVGVDRAGRLQHVGVQLAGVPAHRAVFHVIPTVEGDRVLVPHGGRRLRRRQGGFGLAHAFGDPRGQALVELASRIGLGPHLLVATRAGVEFRAGVRVGGGDHHVIAAKPRDLLSLLAGALDQIVIRANQIQGDQRGFRVALLEHDGLRVEVVVDALGAAFVVVAGHGRAERGRDLHGRRPDSQRIVIRSGKPRRSCRQSP